MWLRRVSGAAAVSGSVSLLALSVVSPPPTQTEPRKHMCAAQRKFVPNCGEFKLFSGSAHKELALNIAKNLGTELQPASVGKFNDGEVSIKVSFYYFKKNNPNLYLHANDKLLF